MIKGIIFDMDGVITDTEYFDFQVEKDFISLHNPSFNQDGESVSEIYGQSHMNLYQLMRKYIGGDIYLEVIESEFSDYNQMRYQTLDIKSVYRKDTIKVLQWAKEQGLKIGLASSSNYSHIISVLETCGIKQYFDVIYSGEFVEESKPNPQIYINTLMKMGLDASECISLEDSYFGISAAKKAGIYCVAYKESRVYVNQDSADEQIADMNEYLELLKSLV